MYIAGLSIPNQTGKFQNLDLGQWLQNFNRFNTVIYQLELPVHSASKSKV